MNYGGKQNNAKRQFPANLLPHFKISLPINEESAYLSLIHI